MTHQITLKDRTPVTHDTNRYIFEKPQSLDFEPGQATEMTLQVDGYRDAGRPFTFTSQPADHNLEFVIKSYPEHEGVTDRLADLEPGAQVEIVEPFGAISDHGAGVFVAAGAGITPFIPILRKRDRMNTMDGCKLLFSNKTEADIIMRGEWEAMQDLETVFTVTEEDDSPLNRGLIDKDFLKAHVDHFDQPFYICGPQSFVNDVRSALKQLDTDGGNIVTEEGW